MQFVEDQREETLEVAKVPLVYNKDPFLRIKKDRWGATAELGPLEKGTEGNEEGYYNGFIKDDGSMLNHIAQPMFSKAKDALNVLDPCIA